MRYPVALQARPKAMKVIDAVRYTGLSESYLRLLIDRRQLPHVRAGRAVRLLVDDLDAFLMSRRQSAQ